MFTASDCVPWISNERRDRVLERLESIQIASRDESIIGILQIFENNIDRYIKAQRKDRLEKAGTNEQCGVFFIKTAFLVCCYKDSL